MRTWGFLILQKIPVEYKCSLRLSKERINVIFVLHGWKYTQGIASCQCHLLDRLSILRATKSRLFRVEICIRRNRDSQDWLIYDEIDDLFSPLLIAWPYCVLPNLAYLVFSTKISPQPATKNDLGCPSCLTTSSRSLWKLWKGAVIIFDHNATLQQMSYVERAIIYMIPRWKWR